MKSNLAFYDGDSIPTGVPDNCVCFKCKKDVTEHLNERGKVEVLKFGSIFRDSQSKVRLSWNYFCFECSNKIMELIGCTRVKDNHDEQ